MCVASCGCGVPCVLGRRVSAREVSLIVFDVENSPQATSLNHRPWASSAKPLTVMLCLQGYLEYRIGPEPAPLKGSFVKARLKAIGDWPK